MICFLSCHDVLKGVLLMTLQVFFSSYIFKANVMVQVATQQASNPVSILVWTGI